MLRVFHKQAFPEIGNTRFTQKHFPNAFFPKKYWRFGLVKANNFYQEKCVQENMFGKSKFGKNM